MGEKLELKCHETLLTQILGFLNGKLKNQKNTKYLAMH